jgi:pimeloyl-ACP methyl ester carboxylesterase
VRWDRSGEGPPIVLVHGTPWSSFNLHHLIQGLSADHSVYFFDLLGYGQSSMGEGDVSLGIQNHLLDHLLTLWKLEAPIVIGHDFGGATALRTLLINRRRFSQLVLIDPVALSPWGSPFFRHVQQHEAALTGLPDFIHAAAVRAYVQSAAHRELDDAVWESIVAPWTSAAGQAAFYRQIAQADERYTDEIQSRYPQIDLPTLILWGREDRWIPVDRGQRLHALIPGSELVVIDDAGHLVIEERPDALLSAIRPFIRR